MCWDSTPAAWETISLIELQPPGSLRGYQLDQVGGSKRNTQQVPDIPHLGLRGQQRDSLSVHLTPRACPDRASLTPSPMVFPGVTVTENRGLFSRPCSIVPAEFSPVSAHPQRLTDPYPTLPRPDPPMDLQQSKTENRCPLSYTFTLGALFKVRPPSFNFRDCLGITSFLPVKKEDGGNSSLCTAGGRGWQH